MIERDLLLESIVDPGNRHTVVEGPVCCVFPLDPNSMTIGLLVWLFVGGDTGKAEIEDAVQRVADSLEQVIPATYLHADIKCGSKRSDGSVLNIAHLPVIRDHERVKEQLFWYEDG